MSLKNANHNDVKLHKDIHQKIFALKANGYKYDSLGLIVNLFKTYESSNNDIFCAHIEFL